MLASYTQCASPAQVNYLNKALAEFGTAEVVPIYYVTFTSCAVIGEAPPAKLVSLTFRAPTISMLEGGRSVTSSVPGQWLYSRIAAVTQNLHGK